MKLGTLAELSLYVCHYRAKGLKVFSISSIRNLEMYRIPLAKQLSDIITT